MYNSVQTLYFLLVIINVKTGWIFHYDDVEGYIRGPIKNITYLLALARAGVKFYLDDFGTGYSNLTNVISLPFSTIKMDRSLVLAMEEGQKGVSLFFDLVSTFKGVGFKILVEGVETNCCFCKLECNYFFVNLNCKLICHS